IIDRPLVDINGLELECNDKAEWTRLRKQLAISIQNEVLKALGPTGEQILELREEAWKQHTRLRA
ncbi:unnamed protein product, partial [Prorocentrum cordatum]